MAGFRKAGGFGKSSGALAQKQKEISRDVGMKKNILVLGANGFLGKAFCEYLKNNHSQYSVYSITRRQGKTAAHRALLPAHGGRFHVAGTPGEGNF